MIRAVLVGATGRMGQAIICAAARFPDIAITAAVASAASVHLGRDAGELAGAQTLGVVITHDLAAALQDADVALDFSTSAVSGEHLLACRQARVPLLVGTTGHTGADKDAFALAASDMALLVAPNTSLGVTVLLELARMAAAALPGDFDAEILEAHHRMKADAPSGTALALGAVIAQARNQELAGVAVMGRSGAAPRRPGEIGFAVVRGGDLVGDHSVIFAGEGETLTLTHRATDRNIFARGALKAAAWLVARPPGLYSMRDIFIDKTGC
jgi:4-hydroxy-tetrahydrodipicolinate reductase